MQLMFPPTCQGKGAGASSPSSSRCLSMLLPLCQMWSFPFHFCLRRNLHTQWREIENGMFVSLPWERKGSSWKTPHTAFNILFWGTRDRWEICDWFCFLGATFPPRWQLWANKPVGAAVSLPFISRVMIRLHNTLRAQTFTIRHNDAHCHSTDVFRTSALISLENVFLMHSLLPLPKKKKNGAWFSSRAPALFSGGVFSSLFDN